MTDKKKLAIIMLGAPGSGKGTQGEILEQKTGFKRYVMSDMLKKELAKGSEMYDRVFKKGILLSDGDVFLIFRKYFGCENEVIIDGIPRTLDQAYWLYGFLMHNNYEIKLVYLVVDEKKLLKRIISRKYCPKCHTLYNDITKKPKKLGYCDYDGEVLIQREDDTKEVFSGRLKTFDEIKNVILAVYKAEMIEVDGDLEIDEVSKSITKKIITR